MSLLTSTMLAPQEAESAGADILGLDPGEVAPVQIILAAQLRLRDCRRRSPSSDGRPPADEARKIVAARDALLRRAIAAITVRVEAAGPP